MSLINKEQRNDELHRSIYCPTVISQIANALDLGADINSSNNFFNHKISGTTLLSEVSDLGSPLPVIEYLVGKAANLNETNRDGSTPLTFYIKQYFKNPNNKTFKNIIEILIKNGANVCKSGSYGNTPLSLAVSLNQKDLVELLLNNGAQHNIQTAFLIAIQNKNLEIIRVLISRGARINYKYKKEHTPLIQAILTNEQLIVQELFINKVDPNLFDIKGTSPLVLAVEQGNKWIFELLLKHGANINIPDVEGNLPIVKSIETGNFFIMKTLVDKKANLDLVSKCGCTPLTKSIEVENFQMVKYLVESGADVNKVDNNQNTPLFLAMKKFDIGTFEFLIDSGANVELSREKIEEFVSTDDDLYIYFETWTMKNRSRNRPVASDLVGDSGHEEA